MSDEQKPKKKLKHGLAPSAPIEVSEASMRQERIAELEDYLRECVGIDPLQINEEFIRIPGDLAYWNAKYARALRKYLTLKVDLDIQRARLEPMLRKVIIDGGGKPTVDQVKAQIEQHDDIISLRYQLVDAEVEKNEVFGSLDAIRSKKEMLVSLGAHLRAEMGGDPLIRDQQRHFSRDGRGEDGE